MKIEGAAEKPTLSFEEVLDKYGSFAFTNVGTSMMPLIRQGEDVMIIEKKGSERQKKYDVVLYRRGKYYILHRILRVRKNDYVIAGDNCYTKERGIKDEQIIGRLVAIERGGRHIDVRDRRYRAYVHLWCDFYIVRAAILWCKSKLKPKR